MPRKPVAAEDKLCAASICLRRAQVDALERASRERDCSRATLIRQILKDWLQEHGYAS